MDRRTRHVWHKRKGLLVSIGQGFHIVAKAILGLDADKGLAAGCQAVPGVCQVRCAVPRGTALRASP